MFGSTMTMAPDASLELSFELESLAGLKRAELIGDGVPVMERPFDGAPRRARAQFNLRSHHARWYALIVEDSSGHKAYSDPVWIGAPATADH
jgi:hypothetical protein